MTSATLKVVQYEVSNLARSRWLVAYAAFFLLVTDALLRFGGSAPGTLLGLVNVVLLVVPLVAVTFGTMYLYDAREFTELLLAQPVSRRDLFRGLYVGLALPLALAFVVGVSVPLLLHGAIDASLGRTLATLLVVGVALTAIFTALAFLIAVRSEDKVRGLGIGVAAWLLCAVVYDGLVLLLVAILADYPLERPLLFAMLANPVDLARVVLLLQFDVSALMGYTGAVFKHFFGSAGGMATASAVLLLWAAVPIWLGGRAFRRKDF